MPLTIAAADRRLAIVSLGMLVLVIVFVVFLARIDAGSAFPSSYGAGSTGSKAAFLLLERTGYSPQRWTSPPRELASLPANTTLVLADPLPTEESDMQPVRDFLTRGGRVVGTGATIALFVKGRHQKSGTPHFAERSYWPQTPSALTRGVSEIVLAPRFYFYGSGTDEAPFQNDDEIPVTEFPYGRGEVVWWSSSDPLTNSGIREKDNAQLLLNSMGAPGTGPVLWDEYFHQGGKTVLDSILESSLRWGLAQVALAGAVVCFSWSRRFGPVRTSIAGKRLAPIEFVETLASLYKRSKASNVAVEIAYERFRTALQRRYSVRRDVPAELVAQFLAHRLPPSETARMSVALLQAERAIGDSKLRTEPAAVLIQDLYAVALELNLKL